MSAAGQDQARPAPRWSRSTKGLGAAAALLLMVAAAAIGARWLTPGPDVCAGWSFSGQGPIEAEPTNNRDCVWDAVAARAFKAQAETDASRRQGPLTRGLGGPSKQPVKKLGADAFDRRVEAAIKKTVKPALLALNIPATIAVNQSTPAIAVLKTADDQTIEPLLAGAQGERSEQRIEVTADVAIFLGGADLEITPEEPDWRTLTRRSPAAWTWRINAPSEGEKTLTVAVRGKVKIGDDEKAFDSHLTTRKIAAVLPAMQRATQAAERAQIFTDILASFWWIPGSASAVISALALRSMRRDRRSATGDAGS